MGQCFLMSILNDHECVPQTAFRERIKEIHPDVIDDASSDTNEVWR